MRIMAIDPGTTKSAYVLYDTDGRGRPIDSSILSNEDMKRELKSAHYDHLAIEMIKSYGNVMGDSLLTTCVWIGRFIENSNTRHSLITRKEIVTRVCGMSQAKDKNVRQAMIDRFGGKDRAIGKKATPGPLYGFKDDMWAALAVAVATQEKLLDNLMESLK